MSFETYCKGLKEGFLLHVEIGRVSESAKALIISLDQNCKEEQKILRRILRKCGDLRIDCDRIFCNGTDCRSKCEKIFRVGGEIIQEFEVLSAQINLSRLSLPEKV
jgi:hypothetical protein